MNTSQAECTLLRNKTLGLDQHEVSLYFVFSSLGRPCNIERRVLHDREKNQDQGSRNAPPLFDL